MNNPPHPYFTRLAAFMSHALAGATKSESALQELERYHLKLALSSEAKDYYETTVQFGREKQNFSRETVFIGESKDRFYFGQLEKEVHRLLVGKSGADICEFVRDRDERRMSKVSYFPYPDEAPSLLVHLFWPAFTTEPMRMIISGQDGWVTETIHRLQEHTYTSLIGKQ